MSPESHPSSRFRPDVEGLRALAILPVIAYHANNALVPGGFIGVDIFFVISGFLITGIILREMQAGEFSLQSFYLRRIRRIFPALFFMLSAALIAGCFLLSPLNMIEFGRTVVSSVLFFSNWQFMQLSDYFDGTAELKPLLHTWSLAVEEQFYIVFPLLLLMVRKWFKGRFAIVIGGIAVLSLVKCLWVLTQAPIAAFYVAQNRAYELLIGAFLAAGAVPALTGRGSREAAAAVGFAMILTSLIVFDNATVFPGLNALLPCVGAALIIHAGSSGDSVVGRALSLGPVRFVGAISYALYLWHWPVLVFARHYTFHELTPAQILAAIAFTFLMAVISYRFIERPFRKHAVPGVRWQPFAVAGTCAAVLASMGAVSIASQGLPQRFSAPTLAMYAYSKDYNPKRSVCHGGRNKRIAYEKNCIYGDTGAAPQVAIWGDSYGAELVVGLGEVAARHHESIMQITSSACPPALHYNPRIRPACAVHNDDVFAKLKNDPRIQEVLLVGYYGEYQQDNWNTLAQGLREAALGLTQAGKHVVLIYPWPTFQYPVPMALGALVARNDSPYDFSQSRVDFVREDANVSRMLDGVAEAAHAQRILTADMLCDARQCKNFDGAAALYWDEFHVSIAGARRLAAAFPPLFGPDAPGVQSSATSTSPHPLVTSAR